MKNIIKDKEICIKHHRTKSIELIIIKLKIKPILIITKKNPVFLFALLLILLRPRHCSLPLPPPLRRFSFLYISAHLISI